MPNHPNVNISNQFNTWYVPFLVTLPPHSGHTADFSDRDAVALSGLFRGFGPGFLFASTSGKAFFALFRS